MMLKSRSSRTKKREIWPLGKLNRFLWLAFPALLLMLPSVTGLCIVSACASSGQTRSEPPGTSTHQPEKPGNDTDVPFSPVYVEEAVMVPDPPDRYLRISGHLPTPCHHLATPEFRMDADTLHITLKSWQKPDVMCAQVLEPFVYYLSLEAFDKPVPVLIRVNEEPVIR